MKRSATILVIALVIIGALFYGLKHSNDSNPSPVKSTSTPTQPSASTSATDKVSIASFAFSPANITVKKGTMVSWTNNDSVQHTVTENDGREGPNSPTLKPGERYSFQFSVVGQFHYHCTFHSDMVGTVTVTD